MTNFKLNILNQHWLSEDINDDTDTCSHGEIELIIGDKIIMDKSFDMDWTLSTTALSLLRTLDKNYVEHEYYTESILYDGGILMLGSPITIDWDIKFEDEFVTITNVRRCLETNFDYREKLDISVKILYTEYKEEILKFVSNVCEFFNSSLPRQIDSFDADLYDEFVIEFNQRLIELDSNLFLTNNYIKNF